MNTAESPPTYGFHGRLKAEFPSQVIVDATEICNLSCIHCPHPEFKKSGHYGGRHLAPEVHDKLIAEVADAGRGHTQYIRYTSNGEPLVHPRIFDYLQHAVDHSGVWVTLTTNGTIMNEARIEKLMASGLHLVDVSIDAFSDEAYAAVRHGTLATTRANVLTLIRLKRESGAKTKIVVSFVEQPQNTQEVDSFRRFWTDAGADSVIIRRLHSAAGGVQHIAAQMKHDVQVPRFPCLYPWERISLTPKGELAFCPQDWTHGSVVGDYRTTSIQAVWQNEFYRGLREAHLCGNFGSHTFCANCPDWVHTRWPGSGRSYADMVDSFKKTDAYAPGG